MGEPAIPNSEKFVPSETAPVGQRLRSLDALRGLAATSVVLLHFTTDFHRDLKPARISALSWDYGAYGVHLFFLISGFVILMTAEKARRARDFVVSRFSRLYPPYWAAVVMTTLVLIVAPVEGVPDAPRLLRRALVNFSMFQSWLRIGSVDSVYWTLQVEMSFYLIMLVLIWRKVIHRALPVMAGLVVLALVDHMLVPRPWSVPYGYVRELLILEYAYLFTAGMVLYQARQGFRPQHALILVLCALCPATANYAPNSPAQDTTMAVLLATVLYLAISGRLSWLESKPLLYLGTISYSLYLTHHWLGLVSLKHADNAGIDANLALVSVVMMCLLLASLANRVIERPSLAWFRTRLGSERVARRPAGAHQVVEPPKPEPEIRAE